ncbi:MAG: hypothetical protein J5744_01525, partial [Oscillospiraceae bacterium]|nr:hypothetical protein [Oscillospiraceae bacterium]
MRGLKKKITALSLILLVLAAAFPMRALAETGAEYAAEITEEATETKAAEETFTQEEPGNTAGQEDAEHAAPVQESLGNEPGSSGTYAEECPVDTDIEIADREETASGTENAGSTGEYDTAADEPEDESVAEEGTFPGQENSVTEVSGSCDENGNGVAEEGVEKNERPEETEQESMPEDTGKEEGEDAGEQDGYEYGRDDDTAAQGDGGEEEGGEEGEDADELSQADGAAEGDAEEQAQEGEGKVYTFTVELLDVRDNVTVFRNGEKAAGIFGNNSPGEGSYFIAGAYRPEILREDPDGITRLGFGAEEGDVFRIEVQEPGYAVIGFACDGEAQYSGGQGRASYEVKISEDTTVRIDGDYSASAGYLSIGGNTRSLRSSPSAPSMPYSMYFWLGDSYDDYSSTAMINGHTGVYFFHPSGAPSGLYVSAVCGNTYRHMESGTHYRVARIAETAARSYLWYGDGCCSPRDQRALAWLIHHGQTEYDWRVANEGSGRMGDGKLYVSSQLEAYTITFLAAWVLTNDGRTGDYGTVYASNGAASLDAMFGSAFSGGLPWSTRSAIDRMVSWALDFADRHTDPDAAIDEYRETYVYSDGYGDHQPLLVGAYRGHANGYLAVKKISTDPSITDGNGMYSFEGTEFTVTDANGGYCGTLTTDADGNTGSLYLTAGTYYVEETAAGNGYKRNTERKAVTVTAYETVTVTFENSPLFDPAGLHMRKWDSTSDSFVPQGIGSFSGARYRMDYYDNPSWQGTPEASWVLESDENGNIYYLPGYLVEGPDLYESGGAYVLPLGSVKLTEIQA